MLKLLFSPSNDSAFTNLALLVLRLWLGSAMFFNHGLDKLIHFKDIAPEFPDPLGFGHPVSLALVLFAEVVGSLLLIMGLVTRFAALTLVIDLFVAFLMVHQSAMNGKNGGELAFIYLSGFVVLVIAGGGMISLDMVVFGKSKKN
ncbi:MAG: DoxX family protein [Verrucomicrobiota bacterium]